MVRWLLCRLYFASLLLFRSGWVHCNIMWVAQCRGFIEYRLSYLSSVIMSMGRPDSCDQSGAIIIGSLTVWLTQLFHIVTLPSFFDITCFTMMDVCDRRQNFLFIRPPLLVKSNMVWSKILNSWHVLGAYLHVPLLIKFRTPSILFNPLRS